jgi:hypothetical protein
MVTFYRIYMKGSSGLNSGPAFDSTELYSFVISDNFSQPDQACGSFMP